MAGDTVRIAAGLYQGLISITLPLNLVGAGVGKTVLEGTGHGAVLRLDQSGQATITGVTVQQGGGDSYGDV